MTQEIP